MNLRRFWQEIRTAFRLLVDDRRGEMIINSEQENAPKKKRRFMKLPDDVIMEVAKCLLPNIVDFYETEEGKAVAKQLEEEARDHADRMNTQTA